MEADCAARLSVTWLFSRGSTKYASGVVPLLVTRTKAVLVVARGQRLAVGQALGGGLDRGVVDA